MSKVIETNPK